MIIDIKELFDAPGTEIPLSAEDIYLSEEIYALLKTVGVELVDHIVFAEDDYVSFAASGIDFQKNI